MVDLKPIRKIVIKKNNQVFNTIRDEGKNSREKKCI